MLRGFFGLSVRPCAPRINGDDFFLIDSNVGRQTLGVFAPSGEIGNALAAVPEAGAGAVIAAAAAFFAPVRRRRVRRGLTCRGAGLEWSEALRA